MFGNLIRSTNDKHVLTSSVPRSSYDALLGKARNNADLVSIFSRIDPWSGVIDIPPKFDTNPSGKLFSHFTEREMAVEALSGLDRLSACGAYVRKGELPPGSSLARLSRVPPADIHSMQRGENWIGDFYSADLIVDTLALFGIEISAGQKVLDYGCSSGAMLRVLAWAYPSAFFYGTDPVAASIDWAAQNLAADNLQFLHQDQKPPLPIENDSLDFVTAISIFSHHGMNASKIWFDDIARILKSGGICTFTAHGPGSLVHYMQQDLKPVERYRELSAGVLAYGYAFEEPWLHEDDVGNIATDAEWGNSFYTPQALISTFSQHFDLVHLAKRANQGNQDVYVIRKR